MNDNVNYDHVAAFYEFAKENGYKVQNFKVSERKNKKGPYHFVEAAYIVSFEEHELLELINEIEDELNEIEENKEV